MLIFILVLLGILSTWVMLRLVIYFIKWSEERTKGNDLPFIARDRFCARCDRKVARSKRLISWNEIIFGGWSCPYCGSEYDQVGQLSFARADVAHLRGSRNHQHIPDTVLDHVNDKTPVERLIDE